MNGSNPGKSKDVIGLGFNPFIRITNLTNKHLIK